MSSQENKGIVVRHLKEVIEQGHVDLIDTYLAQDGTTTNLPTKQELKDLVLWHQKHCPGYKMTILDLMAEGDKVMAHIQYEMTYSVPTDLPETEELMPLNKPFIFRNMNIFTILDGKMVGQNPVTGFTDALIEMGAVKLMKVF